MDRFLPQGCLDDEATPTTEHTPQYYSDPQFRTFVNSNRIDSKKEAEWQLLVPFTQAAPTEYRYRDSSKKFSSLKPNQALLWALIDDSPQNADQHEEAIAIMNGWCPKPWKGMVWHGQIGHERVWTGPIYQDLLWTGTDWEPKAASLSSDKPLVMAGPSKVSVKLAEHFRLAIKYERACTVTAKELNQAFQDFDSDRTGQEENFWVTVSAFVRSSQRLAQCRKLIMRQPEIWMGVDDILMGFIVKVRESIEGYKHDGKLDRWIAVVWKNFIKDKKKEVRQYLRHTFFVNNRNVGDPEFQFQKHCVNTKKIAADLPETESELALARLLSELNDPNTPFGQLKDPTKIMLRHMAAGRNQKQCAVDLGVSEKTIQRWMVEVQKAGREMLAKVDGCDDESNLLPWPEQNTFSIQACAAPSENKLADMVEEFETAITVQQLATILQCSRGQIYKLIDEKRLPALKVGTLVRLDPSQVAAWIRSKMTIAA